MFDTNEVKKALGNDYVAWAALTAVNAIAFGGGVLCTIGNYYKNRTMTVIGAGIMITMPAVSQAIYNCNIKETIKKIERQEAN